MKKVCNGFVTEVGFGHKILFDGYLTFGQFLNKIALIINYFLFDGYLTFGADNPKILCNGYVTEKHFYLKSLCDGHVIVTTLLNKLALKINNLVCDGNPFWRHNLM